MMGNARNNANSALELWNRRTIKDFQEVLNSIKTVIDNDCFHSPHEVSNEHFDSLEEAYNNFTKLEFKS